MPKWKTEDSFDTWEIMFLQLKSWKMDGLSRFTYANCLGVRIVSDLPPVIWSMTESLDERKGYIRLNIFRITGESVITRYTYYRGPGYRVPAVYVYTSISKGGLWYIDLFFLLDLSLLCKFLEDISNIYSIGILR
jgi:hypothetical protein